jgi:hypothetical protein
MNDHRLTKRSSDRAAVKAYIKAQALRISTRHVAQRGGPFKMHLESSQARQHRTCSPRADPSKEAG